jgi:hypothetical protein
VFALGAQGELAAGLRGGVATPWFKSLDILNDFCFRNMSRIRTIAAAQEENDDYQWVDMTAWK